MNIDEALRRIAVLESAVADLRQLECVVRNLIDAENATRAVVRHHAQVMKEIAKRVDEIDAASGASGLKVAP